MTKEQQIKESLRKIVGAKQVPLFTATVSSVSGNTCTVKVGTIELEKVRLTAAETDGNDTIIIEPAANSIVLVADLSGGDYRDLAVVQYGVIKDIIIMGGANEGLVKVKELTSKINAVEQQCNTMLSILKSISVVLAPSGTYPFAPLFASLNPLTQTNKSEIQNSKVKH